MGTRKIALALAVAMSMSAIGFVACDDGGNAVKEQNPVVDSGGPQPVTDSGGPTIDSGSDGAPSDCFMNPTTHLEIINACTDAVKITKNPTLPLLAADGGLPPLP
jgi:hypothetical protein